MRVIDTAIRNRAKTTAPMRVLLAERRYSLERSFLPKGFEASPEKSAINLTHFLREKKQWQSLTYRITLSVKKEATPTSVEDQELGYTLLFNLLDLFVRWYRYICLEVFFGNFF